MSEQSNCDQAPCADRVVHPSISDMMLRRDECRKGPLSDMTRFGAKEKETTEIEKTRTESPVRVSNRTKRSISSPL